MIEASELSKDYGLTQALRGVSFSIKPNEVVGLLGPNGAGKTTLMKILTGFLYPTFGRAEIEGVDVVEDPLTVQSKIGYLPENAPLYFDMVVQEYLQMMAALRQIPEEQHTALIATAVKQTGLEKHLIRPIGELSKGYRQRVGLAQAILHRPRLLVLDEPTSGLDPSQIAEIRDLLKKLAQNATVLLSTHILSEVEVTCERVLIINEGVLRVDARLDELRASNAAIVSVASEGQDAAAELSTIPGVTQVAPLPQASQNGFAGFRVTGGDDALCPRIFDLVKTKGWRLAELRPDRHTLESVFRQITEGAGE